MGNKNARGNTAQARPSTAIFAKIASKKKAASDAAEALAAIPPPTIDLKTLPPHPAIQILGDKQITVRVELCINMPEPVTDMETLLQILPHYETGVKKIAVYIHSPFPHTEANEKVASRVKLMKKFYGIIDNFKWTRLDINMYIDKYNFPQMKLAAGLWGLRRRNWKLTYEVHDFEGDYVNVPRGSQFGRRLSGVYKKEFLA